VWWLESSTGCDQLLVGSGNGFYHDRVKLAQAGKREIGDDSMKLDAER
jgi:hypothetical protein